MIDKKIVVGPFQCNCRLLACPETREAVLIDPGDEPQKILEAIDPTLKVVALFHTHAHLDHIGGTRAVKEALGIPSIYLHKADQDLYRALKMQGQMFGMEYDEPLPVDQFYEDEQEIRVGKLKLTIIHTPGHSPGGVCLRLHEDSAAGARETVFSGDTLFQQSIGRTDLWGGDQDLLLKSIRSRLFTLDDDTGVCPGHGPDTSIGIEKRENPFL